MTSRLGAVLTPLCLFGLLGCGPSADALREQTLTFNWSGESYTHTYLCAPTVFPELRRGGMTFDGASPRIRRGVETGWSPIPQWAVVGQGSRKFAVKLVCKGQYIGEKPVKNETVVRAIEIFFIQESRDAVASIGNITAARSVTEPKAVKDVDAAGRKITGDIQALFPLSGILRAFPRADLGRPSPVTPKVLFQHAENRESYEPPLERDPFLETDFFKTYIAEPLANFTAVADQKQGE